MFLNYRWIQNITTFKPKKFWIFYFIFGVDINGRLLIDIVQTIEFPQFFL
jgi:hypothetical protein